MTPDAQPIPGFLFDKRQANLADFPILAEDLKLSALFSMTLFYFFLHVVKSRKEIIVKIALP